VACVSLLPAQQAKALLRNNLANSRRTDMQSVLTAPGGMQIRPTVNGQVILLQRPRVVAGVTTADDVVEYVTKYPPILPGTGAPLA
jgi:hypothetical protein